MYFLIIDDHAVVRRGTMNILNDRFPHCRFAEAGSLLQARHFLEESSFDVIILDISLPDGSGLQLLADLPAHPPVIVLSMHDETEYALRCASLGARGYLSKNSAPEELGDAVETVLSGGMYIGFEHQNVNDDPLQCLSTRERELVVRLGRGETLTGIAADLGVSIQTAGTYRSRALRKLGLETTAALLRFLIETGATR